MIVMNLERVWNPTPVTVPGHLGEYATLTCDFPNHRLSNDGWELLERWGTQLTWDNDATPPQMDPDVDTLVSKHRGTHTRFVIYIPITARNRRLTTLVQDRLYSLTQNKNLPQGTVTYVIGFKEEDNELLID